MEDNTRWVIERIENCPFVQIFRITANGDEGLYLLIDEDDCLVFLKPIKPKKKWEKDGNTVYTPKQKNSGDGAY